MIKIAQEMSDHSRFNKNSEILYFGMEKKSFSLRVIHTGCDQFHGLLRGSSLYSHFQLLSLDERFFLFIVLLIMSYGHFSFFVCLPDRVRFLSFPFLLGFYM